MSIKVRYFASLKEKVGRSEDVVEDTGAMTVFSIWMQLNPDIPLPDNVLMALNMVYVSPEEAVKDGDEVAFFPPVTGGMR
jgi:molybdopterin synthase sulfur carrier subunit